MEFGTVALFAVVAGAVIVALLRFGGELASTVPSIVGTTSELKRVKARHVIDGDTVIVARFWSEYSVRLDSIDCPEDGQPWGNIAKAGLIKLIGGRHIHIETQEKTMGSDLELCILKLIRCHGRAA